MQAVSVDASVQVSYRLPLTQQGMSHAALACTEVLGATASSLQARFSAVGIKVSGRTGVDVWWLHMIRWCKAGSVGVAACVCAYTSVCVAICVCGCASVGVLGYESLSTYMVGSGLVHRPVLSQSSLDSRYYYADEHNTAADGAAGVVAEA